MWLDEKYIGLVSPRLPQCSIKNKSYNFRCVYCGDSKRNKYKKRAYIYERKKDGVWVYYCHNCRTSRTLEHFLSEFDPALHSEYKLEHMREHGYTRGRKYQIKDKSGPIFHFPKYLRKGNPLAQLRKISQLEIGHPAREFCIKRRIPTIYHAKLFWCPEFKRWTNTMLDDKFGEEALKHEESRIIIPFIDENEHLFGYQGRSIDHNIEKGLRYRSIMLEDRMSVFGIDSVDPSQPIYVFEGPFDSMFIPNSLGFGGSGLHTFPIKTCTLVYDNEPRNENIVKGMQDAIGAGFPIVIWPEAVAENDVNDMILAGYTPEDVLEILKNNTFSGLAAKARLSEWKRVNI